MCYLVIVLKIGFEIFRYWNVGLIYIFRYCTLLRFDFCQIYDSPVLISNLSKI